MIAGASRRGPDGTRPSLKVSVRRSGGRVVALLAAVTALVVGASATPAAAVVGGFKAPVLVRGKCYDGWTATSSTGTTRGVLRCETALASDELVFFSGNGNSWSKVRTGVRGKAVAFADDGTSYFALYEPPGTGRRPVLLLKRTHGTGVQTKITIRKAASAGTDDYLSHGALLVSGGKYWAAYTINNGALLWGKTFTKQNLIASLPSTFPAISGWEPALARRGTSGVTMVMAEPPPFEAGAIIRYNTRADGTWGRTAIRTASGGHSPQVIWSNGVTRISWLELTSSGYRVVYQDNASGAWKRTTVPGQVGSGWARLRMFLTGGKLTFVWSARRSGDSAGSSSIAIAQRSGGTWSSATINAGADGNLLLGAGGWSGKTIVVYWPQYKSTSPGIYSRRQP